MNDLKHTTDIVKKILEEDRQARNSDKHLYLKVLEHVDKKHDIGIETMPVPVFLTYMDHLGFPGFETVRRTRQKIQSDFPELASDKRVAAMRMEKEKTFRAYAKGVDHA